MIPNIKIEVLQSGRLINETVINDSSDISVGRSLENLIVVNEDQFENTFTIFNYFDGKYYLRLHKSICGKLLEGANHFSIRELINNPNTIQKGNDFFYPLSYETRGMLLLGKETILFKIYPGEAIPKKLPKEFRGTFFGGYFDAPFFLIFLFFLISYLFLIYSFNQFKPKDIIGFEKIPERFARLIMDNPVSAEKKVEKKPMMQQSRLVNGEAKSKKEASSSDIKKKTARFGGGNTEDSRSVEEIVRSSGIIGVIGSKGKGGNVANLFQEQGFNAKLDKALKGVSGLYTGKSTEEAKTKRGYGNADGIEIGSLKATTGTGLTAFGQQDSVASNMLGNIENSDIEGTGFITPGMIARALAQHIGAFQYCYNKALQGNPRLKGELKVRFTILNSGMSDKNRIAFMGPAARDTGLTSCIYRVFLRVRFPSPRGGEVTVNYPMSFTVQN